jgi:predicted DNA-binding transcriptional regulator YafY
LEKRTSHATGRPAVPDHSGASAHPQTLTADAIAAELETSKRTIYRDITTLIEQRVPIRGEAGVGYILEKGFDLPPLMLTPDEIEACVLGAQWVVGHADPALARAAQDLMAKVAETVPSACGRSCWSRPAAPGRPGTGSPTVSTWCGHGRKSTRARRSR